MSITIGKGIAGIAIGCTAGFLGTRGTRMALESYYGKDAQKNREWISLISTVTGAVFGIIAATAVTATTTKPLTAVPLPTSISVETPPVSTAPSVMTDEEIDIAKEKFSEIMTEMKGLRDQLKNHVINAFKYIEELSIDSQVAVNEQVSKLFQETVKQYKETLDLWKLAGQKMEAFFTEYTDKIRGFDSIAGQVKGLLSEETQQHENNIKIFNLFQTFLDKHNDTPKSGG